MNNNKFIHSSLLATAFLIQIGVAILYFGAFVYGVSKFGWFKGMLVGGLLDLQMTLALGLAWGTVVASWKGIVWLFAKLFHPTSM